MALHGYDTEEKISPALDRQLPAALLIGNFHTIALACESEANG